MNLSAIPLHRIRKGSPRRKKYQGYTSGQPSLWHGQMPVLDILSGSMLFGCLSGKMDKSVQKDVDLGTFCEKGVNLLFVLISFTTKD